VYLLDVILSYQAQRIGNYRDLPTYMAGLAAMLAGAARMMWTALQNPQLLAAPVTGIKYARAGLDADSIESLGHRFEELMDTQRLCLHEDISLAQVAAKLDTQPHHVSQMVNTRFNENFSACINTRRIQEPAARLVSEECGDLPITTIMYDTGFSSKSAFNREFRRQFGVGPKEYRDADNSR
jgi:AraC-like DNA-binding protein